MSNPCYASERGRSRKEGEAEGREAANTALLLPATQRLWELGPVVFPKGPQGHLTSHPSWDATPSVQTDLVVPLAVPTAAVQPVPLLNVPWCSSVVPGFGVHTLGLALTCPTMCRLCGWCGSLSTETPCHVPLPGSIGKCTSPPDII